MAIEKWKTIDHLPIGDLPIVYQTIDKVEFLLKIPYNERDSFKKWFALCEKLKIKKWKYLGN